MIYCKECKYRKQKIDWLYCQSNGDTIWQCDIGRGKTFTNDVDLDDFCSSAILKDNPNSH